MLRFSSVGIARLIASVLSSARTLHARAAAIALTLVVLACACGGGGFQAVAASGVQGLTLDPTTATFAVTATVTLKAAATLADGSKIPLDGTVATTPDGAAIALQWTSSDATIATVTAAAAGGVVKGVKVGTATITLLEATSGQTASAVVTVSAASLTAIAVTPATATVIAGLTQPFTATGTSSDGSTRDLTSAVAWTSSDDTIASVNSAGIATGHASGMATITATDAATGTKGSATLTVSGANVTGLSITPLNPSLPVGGTQAMTATAHLNNGSALDATTTATWISSDPTVATVDPTGVLTALKAGTASISAKFDKQSAATNLTVTSAILASLAITPASPTTPIGTTLKLTATATYSDKTTLDVTATAVWASADPTIASVDATGVMTGVATGSTTLTATDSASGIKATATATIASVSLASISVSPATPTLPLGTTQAMTATGIYNDKSTKDLTSAVTWTLDTAGAAFVGVSNAAGTNGVLTGKAAGSATLTATDPVTKITANVPVVVTAATLTSISVTPPTTSLPTGNSQQLTAIGTYSDKTTVDLTASLVWSLAPGSSTTVVGVSSGGGTQGLVTALGAGGPITIIATDGPTGVKGTATVTVTAAVLTAINVTPTSATIPKGNSQQFKATGVYSDKTSRDLTATATWSSSATTVATISNAATTAGLATGLGVGATSIGAADPTTGVSGTGSLTVSSAALSSITITPVNPTVPLGATAKLTATGTFTDGTTLDISASVSWASSNETKVKVSNASPNQGFLTTLAVGTSEVTATDSSGKSASTIVTVTSATLTSITVSPTSPTLPKGGTVGLTATGNYSDSSTRDLTTQVSWSTDTSAVANVSNTPGSQGLVSATAKGTATITAAMPGTTVTGATMVTVTDAVLSRLDVTPSGATIPSGTTLQFTATGSFSDGSTRDLSATVTWASTNAAAATIQTSGATAGLATGVGAGSTSISATDPASGKTSSVTLTVSTAQLKTIDVTPATASIPNGTSQPFKALGHYTDGSTLDITTTVTWGTSDASALPVSNAAPSQGLATARVGGDSKETITATDSATGIVGTAHVTLTDATLVSLAVSPAGVTIARGTTQAYVATGSYSDGTTRDLTASVTWTSSDASIATISNASGSAGLATGVKQGSLSISATDPTTSVTASVALTVTAATLTSIVVTIADPSLPKGTTTQATATGHYSDGKVVDLTGTVTWGSSGTSATVSNASGSKGLITAATPGGPNTISAVDPVSHTTGTANVTVTPAVLKAVTLNPSSATLAGIGLTQQFIATGLFTDGTTTDVTSPSTWTSSDSSVATVDKGLAKSVAVGSTTLTALDTASGLSGSASLTVTAAVVTTLTLEPLGIVTIPGRIGQLKALAQFSDGTSADVTSSTAWSSTDTSVVYVNGSGTTFPGSWLAIAGGDSKINALYGGKAASLLIHVKRVASLAVTPKNPIVLGGATLQLQAIASFVDGSTADVTSVTFAGYGMVWSSADPSTVSVSSTGLVTRNKPLASVTITATYGGHSDSSNVH